MDPDTNAESSPAAPPPGERAPPRKLGGPSVFQSPAARERRRLGCGLLVAGILLVYFAGGAGWPAYRDWRIASRGELAPATILALHPTGRSASGAPFVLFRVAVRPTSRPPFEGEFEVPVLTIDAPHLQRGSEIRVKYLVDDPTWMTPMADWRD